MRWSEFGLHLRIRFTPQLSLLPLTIGPFNSLLQPTFLDITNEKKEAVNE